MRNDVFYAVYSSESEPTEGLHNIIVGTLRIACYLFLDNQRDNLATCFLYFYYFRL